MDDDLDGFYKVMDEIKANDNMKRHASPTRRLIAQKNSTWEHKKLLRSEKNPYQYELEYTTEPGKSYIVAPEGGQLNYNLARKNPVGFYDQVLG
jgi:hypothetical protein